MISLNWFDAHEAETFGQELAKYLISQLPPDASGRTLSKKKEVLRKLVFKTEKFGSQNRLNFYKRARLGNTFQWTLLDAGYSKEFVAELTKELMLKL